MGNLIMSFMIALFAFQGFNISYRASSFRKTVIQTPKNVFMTSISILNGTDSNYRPYFDKTILEKSLNEYYKENLKNIVNSYQIDLLYYNTSDHLMCKDQQCDGVNVSVTADVFINMKITQKMYFEVQKNIGE